MLNLSLDPPVTVSRDCTPEHPSVCGSSHAASGALNWRTSRNRPMRKAESRMKMQPHICLWLRKCCGGRTKQQILLTRVEEATAAAAAAAAAARPREGKILAALLCSHHTGSHTVLHCAHSEMVVRLHNIFFLSWLERIA